jgi:hypothetical protein
MTRMQGKGICMLSQKTTFSTRPVYTLHNNNDSCFIYGLLHGRISPSIGVFSLLMPAICTGTRDRYCTYTPNIHSNGIHQLNPFIHSYAHALGHG